MPSREKFAWVWQATMVVTYAAYFIAVARTPAEHSLLLPFALLGGTTVVQVAIIIIASIAIRVMDGPPAKKDERDRAIEHRAATIAYYVLMTGIVLVGCVMPFSRGGWQIVNAAVLAIVIAKVVHHGLVAVGYRWGWHG